MSKTQKHTEEQLKEMREKMLEFYKEQIPYLTTQSEYEKLLADIEESRMRRAKSIMILAQIKAGPEEEKNTNNGKSKPSR